MFSAFVWKIGEKRIPGLNNEIKQIDAIPVMSRDGWPTFREMFESGKHVVVFMDKGTEARTEPAVDFILPQFKMVRLTFFSLILFGCPAFSWPTSSLF
jgi:hypothetical protein